MDKFYVTRKITASGNDWSNILRKSIVTEIVMQSGKDCFGKGIVNKNYFAVKEVRTAWTAMENDFCPDTVMEMIRVLDSLYDDGFYPELAGASENSVTVDFVNKSNQSEKETVVYEIDSEPLKEKITVYEEKDPVA
jgi:hypothetical protein